MVDSRPQVFKYLDERAKKDIARVKEAIIDKRADSLAKIVAMVRRKTRYEEDLSNDPVALKQLRDAYTAEDRMKLKEALKQGMIPLV